MNYLALDIGGTKTSAALFTGEGVLLETSFKTAATETEKGEEAVYETARALVQAALDSAEGGARGIGVGSPGPLNREHGIILHAPLMGWRNFPIVQRLAADFKLPVRLDNDGNLGALAEGRAGVAKAVPNLVYITVSTGCGGGIIADGKLYHGAHDSAGEIGHFSIDPQGPPCPCGSHGCFELYASGTALLDKMRLDMKAGKQSLVFKLAAFQPEKLSGRLLDQAAAAGDEYALSLYQQEGFYLGAGLANVFNMLDPEVIVLGGGITKGRHFFHDKMMETLAERCLRKPAEDAVRYSVLNDRVVLYGAYFLIKEAMENI
ncbi:MAG: ROK family protein [Spirochaetaceae bacterium]|jgi:glucokinase|nr:ROK family protein [Spirochaetaceae bacterium]